MSNLTYGKLIEAFLKLYPKNDANEFNKEKLEEYNALVKENAGKVDFIGGGDKWLMLPHVVGTNPAYLEVLCSQVWNLDNPVDYNNYLAAVAGVVNANSVNEKNTILQALKNNAFENTSNSVTDSLFVKTLAVLGGGVLLGIAGYGCVRFFQEFLGMANDVTVVVVENK